MTVGTPFSTMATHEFVVPRSMPITFSIRARLPSGQAGGSHNQKKSRLTPRCPTESHPLQHEPDGIILWCELGRRLELATGVQPESGGLEDDRQRDTEVCVISDEFARTLRQPRGFMQVTTRLHDRVRGAFVRKSVTRPSPAYPAPGARGLGPLLVFFLVAGLPSVGLAEEHIRFRLGLRP